MADEPRPQSGQPQPGTMPPAGGENAEQQPQAALPHRPGARAGSVDVVGHVPEGVHVDPDVTEGHPGYEESGGSEIRPPAQPGS